MLLAASSGLPLESRAMKAILRPPSPPAALNFSTSIHQGVPGGDPELGDAAGQDRRHTDLDGFVLGSRDERKAGNPVAAAERPCRLLMKARGGSFAA